MDVQRSREHFYAMPVDEMQKAMEAELVKFQEEVGAIEDPEQLQRMEEELMIDFKDYDDYIKEVKYQLDSKVEFDDVKKSANDVKRSIVAFINKIEVDFRSTLAIVQAVRFWKENTDNNIPYAYYESTLRLLGLLKFQGATECLDILTINNWMAPAHDSYKRDTMFHGYLSTIHNEIIKKLQGEPEEGQEMPQ